MRKSHSTILMVAFAGLAACTPPPGRLFLRAPESSAQKTGYVTFSITETGPAGSITKFWPTLYLRGISNAISEKVAIPVTGGLLPGRPASAKSRATGMAADENDPMGKMVLVELPPADYELVGYIVTLIYPASAVVRYLSAPGFEYRFDVVPGAVNYVGDLNFTPTHSPGTRFRTLGLGNPNAQAITGTGATSFNFFGSPDLGIRFQVLDQQDRDAPLFDTRFPAYSQKEKIWCDGCALRNP